MTEQTALIERLRGLLADEPVKREVSMFGGRSFMVNEKMIAGREMGPGWIEVAADVIRNDDDLTFWVDAAMDYNRAAAKKAP